MASLINTLLTKYVAWSRQGILSCLFATRKFETSRRICCLDWLHCLIYSSKFKEIVHRHFYCRTLEVIDQVTRLVYSAYCLNLSIFFVVFHNVWNFFSSEVLMYFRLVTICCVQSFCQCLALLLCKNISGPKSFSNKVAGCETTYEVILDHDSVL